MENLRKQLLKMLGLSVDGSAKSDKNVRAQRDILQKCRKIDAER
jgi:hypothetical protein